MTSSRIRFKKEGLEMSEKEFMWKMRVRIFKEADEKEMSVVGLCS